MSQFEKLWDRFLLVPSDFTYDELRKIMKHYGYSENNKGKTSGSRVVFIKRDDVEKRQYFFTNLMDPMRMLEKLRLEA